MTTKTKTRKISNGTVITGDSMSELETLPENKFHAIITDLPYNFDGGIAQEKWDDIGTAKEYQKWCENWSEKALRTLKPGGHLLAFSGEVSHHRMMSGIEDAGYSIRHMIPWIHGDGFPKGPRLSTWLEREAKEKWGDWRGTLKPAIEPAILFRAPLDGNSSTRNQVKHGTANLNVEVCRIGADDGRYPANVVLDPVMADVMDLESGQRGGPVSKTPNSQYSQEDSLFFKGGRNKENSYDDTGGASRFFYCSKASKPEKTHDGKIENNHNTVKPIDLMEWLIKLVTAEDQWVLDPFVGSGTTLCAAENVGRKSVGIEQNKEYAKTAQKRFAATLIGA